MHSAYDLKPDVLGRVSAPYGGDIFAAGRPAVLLVILLVDVALIMSRSASDPVAGLARYSASARQMAA